jgi:hypothetical protein
MSFFGVLIAVDRMPSQVLYTKSVRPLREYITAYGLAKDMPAVEKTDLVNTILNAEVTEYNEEVLPRGNELIMRYSDRVHRDFVIGTRIVSVVAVVPIVPIVHSHLPLKLVLHRLLPSRMELPIDLHSNVLLKKHPWTQQLEHSNMV